MLAFGSILNCCISPLALDLQFYKWLCPSISPSVCLSVDSSVGPYTSSKCERFPFWGQRADFMWDKGVNFIRPYVCTYIHPAGLSGLSVALSGLKSVLRGPNQPSLFKNWLSLWLPLWPKSALIDHKSTLLGLYSVLSGLT